MKIFLTIAVLSVWISTAIYLLLNLRKKIREKGNELQIIYPFRCTNCQSISNLSQDDYMEIVKKPRNKLGSRSQYLFLCENCGKNCYHELANEEVEPNYDFVRIRRKLILYFLLKEYALGFAAAYIFHTVGEFFD